MAAGLNLKDWVENAAKVQTAVRIAVVPPWRIADVKNHTAINVGSLAICTVLYFILRLFTPRGTYGLTEVGATVVLLTIFLFAVGVAVNFFDPTGNAAKLSNRWSTFLIVSFFYAVAFLILVFLLVPLAFDKNPIDELATKLGSNLPAYIVAVSVAAIVAIALLYWRTRRSFKNLLRENPTYLYSAMLFCVVINAAVLLSVVFFI